VRRGHRGAPSISPRTGSLDVESVLVSAVDGEVGLLGHSYGGAVVTEAGLHPSVRHVVYLCAFASTRAKRARARP
jgi:pimeloyl-ACP methyl ester carboxylesterase